LRGKTERRHGGEYPGREGDDPMKSVEILVIGGGPAGLCATLNAARMGAKVLLVERDDALGGQLVKQTHMFFGSEKQYASTRGVDIGKLLINKIQSYENVQVMKETTIIGVYEDGVVTMEQNGKYLKVKPQIDDHSHWSQ
jgi:sarcosine oxidase, subunit alpha